MALDMYLWFDAPSNGAVKISGEAQDKDLRDKERCEPIRIKQFGFEVSNITTIGSGSGGASSGKCVLAPFTIQKVTDSCSPDFFKGCATGGHYDRATILLRKDGKNFIRYVFSMVFVTKVNWSGGEGDEAPGEGIDFAYGAMRIEYYPQDSSGKLKGKPKIASWNQVNNSDTDTVTEY